MASAKTWAKGHVKKKRDDSQWKKEIHFSKVDPDQQIVTAVVYAPEEVDAQGDIISEEEIQKMMYGFMRHYQAFKEMHEHPTDAFVLESYQAPVDFTLGAELVKKGSWIMTSQIEDEDLWERIKSGEITAYSIGGFAETRIDE